VPKRTKRKSVVAKRKEVLRESPVRKNMPGVRSSWLSNVDILFTLIDEKEASSSYQTDGFHVSLTPAQSASPDHIQPRSREPSLLVPGRVRLGTPRVTAHSMANRLCAAARRKTWRGL
jgi:hypothetical protein